MTNDIFDIFISTTPVNVKFDLDEATDCWEKIDAIMCAMAERNSDQSSAEKLFEDVFNYYHYIQTLEEEMEANT